MFRKFLFTAAAAALTVSSAFAVPFVLQNGQVIDIPAVGAPVNGVQIPTGGVLPLPATQVFTLPNGSVITVPQATPVPILTTPTQVTGVNATTGGLNTAGDTILNTALQPGREASKTNGTLKQVSRPILDAQGKVIGFEQGIEWINSLTGQRHFEVITQTANGVNGVNTQKIQGIMATKKD